MKKDKIIKYDDSILDETLKSYKDEYIEGFVNNILQTKKEKRSEQEYYNKRFQAPFCCGHRMKDNGSDGTEFYCPKCKKIKVKGESKKYIDKNKE